MKFFKDLLSPKGRKYLYRVLLAAMPLLVIGGLVTEEAVPLITAFALAVLGLSIADGNVNEEKDDETNVIQVQVEPIEPTEIPDGEGKHRGEYLGG